MFSSQNSRIIIRCFMCAGWESLLLVVKNSILHGSKEVAIAAINCLQSTVISHSPKVKFSDYSK